MTGPSSPTECSTIQFHMKELTTAFNSLCNSITSPKPNPVEWNSVPLTQIGTINLKTTVTQSFPIPSIIPDSAREVLVYVYIATGHNGNAFTHVKIFTEKSHERRFEKYLSIQSYPQSAFAMVEDNMWFPMTQNRRVYVKLTTALSGDNFKRGIFVIGYR